MQANDFAAHHSATAFLNSLLLEHRDLKLGAEQIILTLSEQEKIILPVKHLSPVGRHTFTGTFYLVSSGEGPVELDFTQLTEKISRHFGARASFLDRVQNSLKNIAHSLSKRRKDIENLYSTPLTFLSTEQGLFLGHTFHPTPKSRSEFSDDDFDRYSPEMGGQFALEWLLVQDELLFKKNSDVSGHANWLREIFLSEQDAAIPQGFTPFVMHPWQKTHILKHPDVQSYLQEGRILSVTPSEKKWGATSSLRTLYRGDSPYQLKFSMNLRLTNSVRHLLVHELDRGLQVHEVFSHPEGKKFLSEHPQFDVIHEPVYAAILDRAGAPIQETLIMGRLNPFNPQSEVSVLATLTQDHPFQKQNLIQNCILQSGPDFRQSALEWFRSFLYVAIRPLLKAQADYGILLGSHQQNMILELKDHRPFKSYFRDCNGTGYTKLGYELFASEVTSLTRSNGNILEGEEANFLFGYYVMINSTFNTLSAVAAGGHVSEEELLVELRKFLTDLKNENPKDPTFLNYLLREEFLQHKGNFFCSIRDINENTEKNPLSIYTRIQNPLFERNKMLTSLKEVSYSPLSMQQTFKARLEDGVCLVKTQHDVHLESKITCNGDELVIDAKTYAEKAQLPLLTVTVEYLLSHLPEMKKVSLTGVSELGYPFSVLGLSFERSEFYQLPTMWHHSSAYQITPEKWLETNERKHPLRPRAHAGYLYQRYVPALEKTISFRLSRPSEDLDQFHEWHNQSRVSFYWELNKPKEELKEYMEKGLQDPHQIPLMVEIDGELVGYFEMYWVREDRLGPYYESDAFDRGFHFLIGNKKFLGAKITDSIVKSALHLLYLDEARTRRVMAEPRHDNQKVLKYAEASIGWRKVKLFDFPHKRAWLLENSREVFFGGNAL